MFTVTLLRYSPSCNDNVAIPVGLQATMTCAMNAMQARGLLKYLNLDDSGSIGLVGQAKHASTDTRNSTEASIESTSTTTMYPMQTVNHLLPPPQTFDRAIVLDYRTYPDATMEEQIDDLAMGVDYFKVKYATSGTLGKSPIILMGHSSGAHIAMMAMLKGKLFSSVDALIGMSGVYNLELAQEFERERGLTDLSPMGPASNGRLEEFLPAWLLNNCDRESLSSLPPLLLLHGDDDPVAPLHYSQELHSLLTEKHGLKCQLEILENV